MIQDIIEIDKRRNLTIKLGLKRNEIHKTKN